MVDRYPDYDVLDKRDTLSWNAKTREVVDHRMSLGEETQVLTRQQLETLRKVVSRVVPQPERRAPANTVALVVHRIDREDDDGFRPASLPRITQCWQRGLDAIEAEAMLRTGKSFAVLDGREADAVLEAVERGETAAPQWDDLPAAVFWSWRLLPDVVAAHWSHPSLWSHMGFGGPASPRGYVRLGVNRRDGWEGKERSGD